MGSVLLRSDKEGVTLILMKYIRIIPLKIMLVLFATVFLWMGIRGHVWAMGVKENPNITWSKDKKAFTTDEGETAYVAYPRGMQVVTGLTSSLGKLKEGEHYYLSGRLDEIPVAKWVVHYTPGQCIHNSYGSDPNWHGISYGRKTCSKYFKSGWVATCADCGTDLGLLFYMDQETAMSLTRLPAGMDYYYLCPWCRNLEQGSGIRHDCKKISNNMYTIRYEKNHRNALGYMEESICYYNNASQYEGKPVQGDTRLRKNTFTREGYVFLGWNTKPDGSGKDFIEEQIIDNLTDRNKETVVLYAQWKSEKDLEIEEKPVTEQMGIIDGIGGENYGSVFQRDEKHYYIKADGQTPFTLSFAAFLLGKAREDVQINHLIYRVLFEENEQRFQEWVPNGILTVREQYIPQESISLQETGTGPMEAVAVREAVRTAADRRVTIYQSFTCDRAWSGKQIELFPQAGVTKQGKLFYSDWEQDKEKGIVIIGDGDPPSIQGTDLFRNPSQEASVFEKIWEIKAEDELSGVGKFELLIKDGNTKQEKRYLPQEDGIIRVDITNMEFQEASEIAVMIIATDRVGNEAREEYFLSQFGLTASITRILSPHQPVFRCGESGILTIDAWGYPEKIEVIFPPQLTALEPSLDHCYVYDVSKWRQQETLQFMIPLYTPPASQYVVLVRAYREGTPLQQMPDFCTISITGSVLGEFRTRLR